jgi:glycosyltransferase involved in cell wall biosynthesis
MVKLVTIAMPECYEKDPGSKEIVSSDKYSRLTISKNAPHLLGTIQKIHDDFLPDAIIGINTYPSYIASKIKSRARFWADLNGWIMAEAQAQAYKMGTNDYLPHYHEMEHAILKRADKFSVVSNAQKFALMGELAGLGRLNKETFAYEFVHHIPNGTEWFSGENAEDDENNSAKVSGIPDDAFILLWLGGYNTWVDELTLYKGVERAMQKCKKLYFVSTGGEVSGLDNKTFAKFKKMIDESKFKDRFIFLGWVDTKNIPYIYERACAGLNVDRKCIETYTGARNRINEMMKFGLPVISTLGSEISYEVQGAGAGIGVENGNHEALGDAIFGMYKEWEGSLSGGSRKLKEYGDNGKKYIEEKCNYDYLIKPLFQWLDNLYPAPDNGLRVYFGKMGRLKGGFRYIKDNGVLKFLKKLWRRVGM